MGARLARDSTAHNAARPAARTSPGSCMASGRRTHRGTELTVVFAIGVCTQRNLDAMAIAASTVPPAKFGVVLTTSGAPPRRLRLPHDYQFLDLREIARPEQNCLAIDK